LQEVSQSVTKTLMERSAEVRDGLAEDLCESVRALRGTKILSSLPHLDERAEVANKLVSSASKAFNWNNQIEKPLIIIGEIENMDPYRDRVQPIERAQVIDVSPAAEKPEPVPSKLEAS
jgi:hypothetical protein